MSTHVSGISGAAAPAATWDAAVVLCFGTLVSAVFLQKIALPGTGGSLPLNLCIFLVVAITAFVFDVVEINPPALLWYVLFVGAGALSMAQSSSGRASALSLGLLLAVQFPLIFRLTPSSLRLVRLWRFLSTLGCVCAIVGLLQFTGQFALGTRLAFYLDTSLPDSVALKGFNSLIPLYYSSPVLKSNGFFFLEPSFFCQFLAVAVVAELLVAGRFLRLVLLGAGLLSSYSGTGLTMLALFLPAYMVRHGNIQLALVAAFGCVLFVFFGEAFSIGVITRRLSEFSDDQSSGWARFLSMFSVLPDVLLANDHTLFTGVGPGTVQQSFDRLPYLAFDPTWGKLLYEYGLAGAFIYCGFFWVTFCKGAPGLRFALGYTYFFLGGYLLNASVLMQMASLVVWCRELAPRSQTTIETGRQDFFR